MVDVLIVVGFGLLMLFGLIGCIVPIFPDLLLIWGAAFGYGLIIDWGERGTIYFALISVLGLLGVVSEFWVSGIGAKKGGASVWGIFCGAVLGGIALFITGPIGAVVAMLLGIFLVEYIRLKDVERAAKAMLGAGLGCGASLGVKLLLGIGMVVFWVIWVVTG